MKVNNIYICIAIVALLTITKNIYSSDGNIYHDENSIFSRYLGEKRLIFDKIKIGDEIYFNNVIIMPKADESGFLSIEFNRSELSKSFIDDVFYNENSDLEKLHPFLNLGIELNLYKDKLILNIYPGIVLHFRNDIYSDSSYTTFENNNVMGRVVNVSGNILISRNTEIIRNNLSGVYMLFRVGKRFNEDGIMTIVRPEKFVPKIIN